MQLIALLSYGPTFYVGTTTVFEAVQDFFHALCEIEEENIKFPSTNQEILATRQTFQELTNIPNVVRAIDGTHVKIKTPTESGPDYFSRLQQHEKCFFLMSLQVSREARTIPEC